MAPDDDLLTRLRQLNDTAAFNRWAGFEVVEVSAGRAVLRLAWRTDLGQYSGHLHAGVVAALIDTACGFAAFTVVGNVVASNCAVTYLAPGRGTEFVATATIIKAGRRQVFASAELVARLEDRSTLIANGQTILVPVP